MAPFQKRLWWFGLITLLFLTTCTEDKDPISSSDRPVYEQEGSVDQTGAIIEVTDPQCGSRKCHPRQLGATTPMIEVVPILWTGWRLC